MVHSHADAILSITNTRRPYELLADAFGEEVAAVAYRRPGFLLSKEVARERARQPLPLGASLLLNHGLVTWGDTPREAYETHIELVTRAEEFVTAGRRVAGGRSAGLLRGTTRAGHSSYGRRPRLLPRCVDCC